MRQACSRASVSEKGNGRVHTSSEPDKDSAGLFGCTPLSQLGLEVVPQFCVRVIVGVLAACCSKCCHVSYFRCLSRSPVTSLHTSACKGERLTTCGANDSTDQNQHRPKRVQDEHDPCLREELGWTAKLVPSDILSLWLSICVAFPARTSGPSLG